MNPIETRFWSKVVKTETCWIWRSGKVRGYGLFYVQGKDVLAHRFSYLLAYGVLPNDKDVLHSCDTPACVRPDHLFTGTHAENMQDRNRKNRQARGERSGRARLTETQVREARQAFIKGSHRFGAAALAKRYGVPTTTMQAAIEGRSWSHLGLPLEKL